MDEVDMERPPGEIGVRCQEVGRGESWRRGGVEKRDTFTTSLPHYSSSLPI
jgi:hypothetical protein